MNYINMLTSNRVLWLSFISTILLTVAFQVAVPMWDLILLDAISDPAQARDAIASMNPDQHVIHAWITATLDVAYPVAYGALFIGSAHKFFATAGWLLALPVYVLVPTDLIEGVVQVLALVGTADFLDAKAYLTPLKSGLFILGLLVTMIGWIKWLWQRLRGSA